MEGPGTALPNSGQWVEGIFFFQLVGRRLTFQLLSGLAGIGWSCWEGLWIRRSWMGLHTLSVNLTVPPSTPWDHEGRKAETSIQWNTSMSSHAGTL